MLLFIETLPLTLNIGFFEKNIWNNWINRKLSVMELLSSKCAFGSCRWQRWNFSSSKTSHFSFFLSFFFFFIPISSVSIITASFPYYYFLIQKTLPFNWRQLEFNKNIIKINSLGRQFQIESQRLKLAPFKQLTIVPPYSNK